MKLNHVSLTLVLISTFSVLGCAAPETPEGAIDCCQCLENPVYDTEVTIFGRVSLLGELFCDCFHLVSGGREILVWYDSMVEDDGTKKPSVSVEGIKNGDWITVTGELKSAGKYRKQDDFWASSISKVK